MKKIVQNWIEFVKEDLRNAQILFEKKSFKVVLGIVIKQLRKF
jgi:hypothetical protein